jgi:ribosomal protein S18 acetylase RimI-like enzyme
MSAATGLAIRPAGRDDVAGVLALWAQGRSEHASLPDTAAAVERLLADRPGALLVAEDAGAIVGALIAASDGWRGNMYRLAVAASHRRRGIARALVAAGEQRLRASGTARITALVAHDAAPARAFWAAAGYADDREIGRFVRNAS